MKVFIKTAFIVLLVASTSLFASSEHSHAGHDHSHAHEKQAVNEDEIKDIAKEKINALVKQKKIAKSWKNTSVDKIELSTLNYKKDWVVSFKNTKVKKQSRQTLYVFVSRSGMVKGVNYTGK